MRMSVCVPKKLCSQEKCHLNRQNLFLYNNGRVQQGGRCTCNSPHHTVTHAARQHCTKTENRAISFCALGSHFISLETAAGKYPLK